MTTYYLSKVSDREKVICAPQLQTESKKKALEWLKTYATRRAAYAVWHRDEKGTGKVVVSQAGGEDL
jgi:hypothetical protein